MNNLIFKNTDFDNFVDDNDVVGVGGQTKAQKVPRSIVHISNQQRNGRKTLTLIAGLAEDLDLRKILKVMRKMFNTNGTILLDQENESEVIQLQGDVRKSSAEFLVKYKVCEKEEIKVHGAQ